MQRTCRPRAASSVSGSSSVENFVITVMVAVAGVGGISALGGGMSHAIEGATRASDARVTAPNERGGAAVGAQAAGVTSLIADAKRILEATGGTPFNVVGFLEPKVEWARGVSKADQALYRGAVASVGEILGTAGEWTHAQGLERAALVALDERAIRNLGLQIDLSRKYLGLGSQRTAMIERLAAMAPERLRSVAANPAVFFERVRNRQITWAFDEVIDVESNTMRPLTHPLTPADGILTLWYGDWFRGIGQGPAGRLTFDLRRRSEATTSVPGFRIKPSEYRELLEHANATLPPRDDVEFVRAADGQITGVTLGQTAFAPNLTPNIETLRR